MILSFFIEVYSILAKKRDMLLVYLRGKGEFLNGERIIA